MHIDEILLNLTIYLVAAVIAVPLSVRLGLGSVLGYLAAGLMIGPALGLVGTETVAVQHYAEFGVVLMLFLIGLEMQPRMLWEMRTRLLGLGGLQVGLTIAAIAGCATLLGFPGNEAVAIGIVLSLSSTAIVMQTLAEKKLSRTEGGRAGFAVLLFQDVAAIPLLAVLPLLAVAGHAPGEAHEATDAMEGVAGWMQALLVVGAVALVILGGTFLTRPFFRFIEMSGLREIHVAAALLLIAGISLMMILLGLSPALGSFLAGVVLANSEYRHELEADLAPFKGLLLGLFFITVGASMDLGLLASDPLRIIGLALGLMLLKFLILYPLGMLFRLRPKSRVLFGLSLAQAGEFGFFLLSFAVASGVLAGGTASTLLLVIGLSMLLTPVLFFIHDEVVSRVSDGPIRPEDEIDEQGTVIIAGMGRFGQIVNRLLTSLGHKTVVLDSHSGTVDRMRRFGIKGFYGAVDRPDLLEAAGIAEAKALVLALDDPEKAVQMAEYVSRRHPHVRIIARARDRHHVYQLYAAGAKDSVRETFDSAVRAGKYAVLALDYDELEADEIADEFFEHDRTMLRELAGLWDPDVPSDRNPAYIEKSKEQHRAIEAALRGRAAREKPRQAAE
jgi:CPA2 family monovalent cation:H+ antiporter-2